MSTHIMKDNSLSEVIGPFYDDIGIQSVLQVPTPFIIDLLKRNQYLLGLQTSDEVWVYPTWQFEANRVKPDFIYVFHALRNSPAWSVALWCVIPNEDLEDKTPLQWIDESSSLSQLVEAVEKTARAWQ